MISGNSNQADVSRKIGLSLPFEPAFVRDSSILVPAGSRAKIIEKNHKIQGVTRPWLTPEFSKD